MPIIRRKSGSPPSIAREMPPGGPPSGALAHNGIAQRSLPADVSTGGPTFRNSFGVTGGTSGGLATRASGSRGSNGIALPRSSRVDLEQRLHHKIIAELRDSVDLNDPMAVRAQIERLFNH